MFFRVNFALYGVSLYTFLTQSSMAGVEDVSNGVLSIDIHHDEHEGFRDYFLALKPNDYSPHYFINFWEDLFNCSTGMRVSVGYDIFIKTFFFDRGSQ